MAIDSENTKADFKEVKNDDLKPKERRDKSNLPLTKVIIRRLPPTMTTDQFLEQISPVPDHDYFNFVGPDRSLGSNAFSVAYINFISQEDIFIFKDKFDEYVFLDSKGNEYPALVEFAPFQKIPRKRGRKDLKCGTIEQDPEYKAFLELLENPVSVAVPSMETYIEEIEAKEKELKANHGVPPVITPLIQYVKERKRERQQLREERREERRRRDLERRKIRDEERKKRKERERQMKEKSIKEKTEESDSHNSDNESVVKVLKNPERKPSEKKVECVDGAKDTKSSTKKSEKYSSKETDSDKFKKKHDNYTRKQKDKEEAKDAILVEGGKSKQYKDSKKEKMESKKYSKSRPDRFKDSASANNSKAEKNPEKTSANITEIIYKGAGKSSSKYCDDGSKSSSEKRIKNKDRPTMEIYRPGMRRQFKKETNVKEAKEQKEPGNKNGGNKKKHEDDEQEIDQD